MTTKIYTLSDPITNEIRYVGKSNNPLKRYYKHIDESTKNVKTHKNNWIKKLLSENKKPILEIIDEVLIEEWVFWETYWISQIKAWGFNLVNNTYGGEGSTFGNQTSFKKGTIPWNKGLPLSDETKEKLRIVNLGKKQTEITKAKKNKKLKGRIVKNLDVLLKNGEKTRFVKGQTPWNKGLVGNKLGGKKKAKEVIQLDLIGNILNEFASISDAAKFVDMSPESIRRCCVGEKESTGGFKYKYKNN